jgi:hypothetical protein
MSQAREHFNRLIGEFQRNGVRNQEQVVEYVAFFILSRNQWPDIQAGPRALLQDTLTELHAQLRAEFQNLHIPEPVPAARWNLEDFIEVLSAIEDSFRVSPHNRDWGEFFQREIRPELLSDTSGSQYPTPYHIANLIAELGITQPNARILDPTMGTGGLLIAGLNSAPNAILTGSDFDPLWAGMGSANLILHNKEDSAVYVGSALDRFNEWQGQFDTVLMNPPFGGSRGTGEVESTVGVEYGHNNATVMGAFALQATRLGGRAAFLTSSGILFANRGAEANLKTALFAEKLETIITLPKRSFYPHSNVEAHLVIAQKRDDADEAATNPVWFCEIERDGYPEGSERDLTAPLNARDNELSRIKELVLNTRDPETWGTQLEFDEIGEIQTILLQPDDGLTGLGIRIVGDHPLPKWNLSSSSTGTLINIRDQENQLQGWISQTYEGISTIAITREDENTCNWTEILSRADLVEGLSTDWENEQADSYLHVQTGDQPEFKLIQAQTTYKFSLGKEHTEIACLLNETGHQITPWLTINAPQKVRKKEFGNRFAAIHLQNAGEEQIGWLIDWTETQDEGDDDGEGENDPLTYKMLIVFQDQVDLFEEDNSVFGFVANGYFQIDRENGRFIVEQGEPIHLRDDVALAGFALGPAPWTKHGFRMFGALLRRDDFSPTDNLRPSRFLPEPEKAPIEHPAKVIASIRKNQTQFNARVDELLSMVGAVSRHEEYSDQAFPVPDRLIGMLDNQQKSLYVLIVAKHLGDGRPAHFNTKDVLAWKEEGDWEIQYSDADIAMQLELLSRMGLLVKVHDEVDNFFRCLTHGDVIEQQAENPEGNYESD